MPMTLQEIQSAVRSVRDSLAETRLRWIIQEVDETLRLGKPAVRTVVEEEHLPPDMFALETTVMEETTTGRPRRRRTRFAAIEAYTTKEELILLLDAIERTAIAAADMHVEVGAKCNNTAVPN